MSLQRQITNDENREENHQLHNKKDQLLMKLLINEITEFLTPIMFLIAFIIAYCGPNATIIGNVQNDYWQYHKVERLSSYIFGILISTAIDLSSAAISLIIFHGFSKINCWTFFQEKIVKLLNIMAVNILLGVTAVSILFNFIYYFNFKDNQLLITYDNYYKLSILL